MSRTTSRFVAFAIAFTSLIVGPALLSDQFGPYPLMKNGDVFDILTPLVLIPLLWLLYRQDARTVPRLLPFLFLAALWSEGQGMHLSANSIGHLLEPLAGSDAETLTGFYDEVLSHFLWHLGMLGLAALIIYQNWAPASGKTSPVQWPVFVAGVLHGLTYFTTIVEANTGPIGVPFAVIVSVFVLARGRGRLRHNPTVAFFFTTFIVATLLFVGWAIYWGGLPEFSEVGIID